MLELELDELLLEELLLDELLDELELLDVLLPSLPPQAVSDARPASIRILRTIG